MIPLLLGIGPAVRKMKDATDIMKRCQEEPEGNLACFKVTNETAIEQMDILGKKELEILTSLKDFSDVFEKIHNRPEFKTYEQNGVTIPPYHAEEIKKVSMGAGILLGGLGGAAMGTAGGFAAAGGIGVMLGGISFSIVDGSLSDKADKAYAQVCKEREDVKKIGEYLLELGKTAMTYTEAISVVQNAYKKQLNILNYIVCTLNKTDWNDFSKEEKLVTENAALLVGLLHNTGKVELVLKSNDNSQTNTVNTTAVQKSMSDANAILVEKGLKEADNTD